MKLDLHGFTPRLGAQQNALNQLANLEAKYILLSAPVGSGKSLIGMAAARGAGSAYIVTPQNILLDQYARDFTNVPMVKGRSHYKCSWANGMTCEDASEVYEGQHTKRCQDYIPARDAFWSSSISVTNLHFAMFAQRLGGQRPLLVVDECHGLEPVLLGLFHVKVLRKDAVALGLEFDSPDVDRLFAEFVSVVPDNYESATFTRQVPDFAQRERIRGTARRLAQIKLRDTQNPWQLTRSQDEIECRPLFARNLAPRLLSLGERVLFMSATPGSPDQFFRNLGIEPGPDTDFAEVDSDFPRGKGICLVKGAPYVSSERLDQQLPVLADVCGQIMRQMKDEKGLILCASYKLASGLSERLRGEFGSRLLAHKSHNRDAVVAKHRIGSTPTVLLGVNMHEGLDLWGDLARFLIIPKVLYSACDSWVRERERLDPGYYQRLTAARMVQACGRVIRGPQDWAYIFVVDANLRTLVKQAPKEFPGYFHRMFHESDYVD
jgi:Rad3-related DNA helicase